MVRKSFSGSCALNFLVLEYFGPEACKHVRVLDLNHCELLEDTVVQAQLLFLKSCNHSITDVDSEEVEELSVRTDLSLMLLDFGGHAANVISGFEQCGDGFGA